ncbi:MAG: PQQ-binding-like beta-propeller repeat protein [Planctomycetia bacterium]|nr:PQQ-binding-like beta-propeller repeat protein [Planctomycetia bacterium]
MRLVVLGVCACLALLSTSFAGDNWPEFRGPRGDGTCDARGLPTTWGKTHNVKWKTALPGQGWSTPVIWGGQVWLTSAAPDGKKMFALCVDKESGKIVRQVDVFENDEPEPKNDVNSYASPSPAIEEGRVYVHFGTYGTACIDTASGDMVWSRRDLDLDHKEGPGSSVILVDDKLVFHCDGMDVQYIVALDKATGNTLWKTDRTAHLAAQFPDFRKAYSTPIVVEVGGRRQIVSTGAHAAYAYDPENGAELWRLPFSGFSNVSRPVAGDGLVFINTGYIRPQLWAVRLGGSGVLSPGQVAWKAQKGVPRNPSAVLVEGLLYLIEDGGVASCLDAKTGEPLWSQRLGGNFSASPVVADGKIFACSQEGQTTVLAVGRRFKQLAVNTLEEGCMASPAISGKALYLRTKTHLYRIEQ